MLYLRSNQISNVAPLQELTQLLKLDLSKNQIRDLSPLKRLFSLRNTDIEFDEDKIEILHPEIIKQGTDAVANYFTQLDEQTEDYLFEAKMLIVGEPGAGKTSLAWKIDNEDCELPDSGDTTKGIDVKLYLFSLSNREVSILTGKKKDESESFRMNLWDFGGQEIYKATHRFFLSKRSLYALVADSRNEDTDFNYWLHIVEMFGGESPLLIILNEKYGRVKTLDIPAMRARFENIVDVIFVDLADDDKTRLRQLMQAIRYHVSRLPHIGRPVPARWTDVREVLEKDSRDTITLREYLDICAEKGIKELGDSLILGQYFHDIGVFLHFQDNPLLKNTIFLNSTWATQAIYQILDDPLLSEREGRFCKKDAAIIWSADEFSLLHDELLELMRKFFLAYKIKFTDEYIVPAKLPASTPSYDWKTSANLVLQYKYDFFMPKGLLSQFIVQMNRYITNHSLVWQRGAILERQGAKAEVTESYDARNIKVRISGANQRDFMTIISEKIDEINSQYEKMKVKKLIPCNCVECKNSETPYFYRYAELKRRIEKKRIEVECSHSYEMVNVRTLIDEVIKERSPAERRDKREKVFISYSHKDNDWLERVQVHLKGLRHLEIDPHVWDDTHIKPGDKWYREIKNALTESSAAILLISADFLASDFIAKEEPPELLHAAENEGLTILPVIIKPSLFSKTKLGEFQAVNDPSKPLSSLKENEQDQVFVNLANRIIDLVEGS